MTNPKSKSKLQKDKEKKKELEESLEYLRQVDVPESQGGAGKFVRDTRKEEKKEIKEHEDRMANWLESRRSQQIGYRQRVAEFAEMESWRTLDSREGWDYNCLATDGSRINIYGKSFKTQEGIVHILRKGLEVYVRAVGVTYEPQIDIANVETMLTQAQNTIDHAKGLLFSDNKDTSATFQKKKSGLWTPN